MPLHRRVPKRGFHNPFRVEYAVVNLDTLAEVFEAGSAVTPDVLRERGLVRAARRPVKVLGRGDIAKALTVQAHKFSGKAAEKIAAAGGTAEVLAIAATATPSPPDDAARRARRGRSNNDIAHVENIASPDSGAPQSRSLHAGLAGRLPARRRTSRRRA